MEFTDQLTFPDGITATEYWRLYTSQTPIDWVPVPPLVRMPRELKLTVIGLVTIDDTCGGNVVSLMTDAPEAEVIADRCTNPPTV